MELAGGTAVPNNTYNTFTTTDYTYQYVPIEYKVDVDITNNL